MAVAVTAPVRPGPLAEHCGEHLEAVDARPGSFWTQFSVAVPPFLRIPLLVRGGRREPYVHRSDNAYGRLESDPARARRARIVSSLIGRRWSGLSRMLPGPSRMLPGPASRAGPGSRQTHWDVSQAALRAARPDRDPYRFSLASPPRRPPRRSCQVRRRR